MILGYTKDISRVLSPLNFECSFASKSVILRLLALLLGFESGFRLAIISGRLGIVNLCRFGEDVA